MPVPAGEIALRALCLGLAVAGLAIACYFTALSYRLIAPDAAFIPRFCRLGETTCARVIDSPRARVFGLPNSLLGVFYYLAVIGIVVWGQAPAVVEIGLKTVAWGTVGLGLFLAYSLLFMTRIPCALCFTAHAINLGLALGLTWAL
jgi:uncharacterized membrane protein